MNPERLREIRNRIDEAVQRVDKAVQGYDLAIMEAWLQVRRADDLLDQIEATRLAQRPKTAARDPAAW